MQVQKVIGYIAPPEFVAQLHSLVTAHDNRITVDCIRAYHHGARFNVELDIVLPSQMNVQDCHQVTSTLKQEVEKLDDVERCYINVDHMVRWGHEGSFKGSFKGSSKGSSSKNTDSETTESPMLGIRLTDHSRNGDI